MERYIAFLRGINVSGQKIIKMDALRKAFTEEGFTEVKTYIQSGNVIFSSQVGDSNRLIQTIENRIEESFGFQTDVILRKFVEIESIMRSHFHSRNKSVDELKYYITFLKQEYPEVLELPLFSVNKEIEIIHQDNLCLITVSTPYKGINGFPNSFIEKLTGIKATTRNPNTLEKLLKL
jgi:uncharacterized protein (DUF1697 family)